MATTVVHCKREAFDVYIGRAWSSFGRSMWANPFHIGKDGSRAEVIAKYEAWLRSRPHDMNMLYVLKDKKLGCWCKPEACHGDVLARLTDEA